jgi:hypothetical protein
MTDTTQVPALLREAAALLRAERDQLTEALRRNTQALTGIEHALDNVEPIDNAALDAMIATIDGPAPACVAVYVDQPEPQEKREAMAAYVDVVAAKLDRERDDQARAVIERIESLAQPDDPGSGTSHEILQAVLRDAPVGGELERWICTRTLETREDALAAIASRREHDPEACDADDLAAGVLLHGIDAMPGKGIAEIVSCIDCPAVVAWILAQERARASIRPQPKAVRKGVTEACESRLAALREKSR